jgi:hypothetical protein
MMDCLIDRLISMDIAESAATRRSPSRIGHMRRIRPIFGPQVPACCLSVLVLTIARGCLPANFL